MAVAVTNRRGSVSERGVVMPLSGLFLAAALAAAAVGQGAFYPRQQWLAGSLLAAGAWLALRAEPWSRADARLPGMRPAAGIALWSLVSAAIAGHLSGAVPVVLLLAGLAAVLMICRRMTLAQRYLLLDALIAVGCLVAVTGWAGVAWRLEPWALPAEGLWRASGTLTYANAAAGLLVPLAVAALAHVIDRPRAPWRAIAACLLLTGAAATLSRAGMFLLVIGVAALAGLLGVRRSAGAIVMVLLGSAVAAAGLIPSIPTDSSPRAGLAVAAMAVGLGLSAFGAIARARSRYVVLAVAAVAAAAFVASRGLPTPDAVDTISTSRFSLISVDRTGLTSAALDVAAESPVTGTGPGATRLVWVAVDGRLVSSHYVHDEYLQVLVALGVVGLGLLIALLVSVAASLWRARASTPPALWAGAVVGVSVVIVHSAFDYLWHVPLIPVAIAVLVGVTLRPEEQGEKPCANDPSIS